MNFDKDDDEYDEGRSGYAASLVLLLSGYDNIWTYLRASADYIKGNSYWMTFGRFLRTV